MQADGAMKQLQDLQVMDQEGTAVGTSACYALKGVVRVPWCPATPLEDALLVHRMQDDLHTIWSCSRFAAQV